MIGQKHITVVIPALDEERAIGEVVRGLPRCVDQVLVVDGGSNDGTVAVAQSEGAVVIREPRRGYGRACLSGIANAGDTDLLAFVDGGRRDRLEDLMPLLESVAFGHCDLAIGCRREDADVARARLPHQAWGTSFACWCIRLIYGVRYEDLGPMRCIGKAAYERLGMQDEDFGWTAEMQIKAFQKGLRFLQMPVRCQPRIGRSKISGTLRGSIMAGWKIFYWIIRLSLAPKSPSAH